MKTREEIEAFRDSIVLALKQPAAGRLALDPKFGPCLLMLFGAKAILGWTLGELDESRELESMIARLISMSDQRAAEEREST